MIYDDNIQITLQLPLWRRYSYLFPRVDEQQSNWFYIILPSNYLTRFSLYVQLLNYLYYIFIYQFTLLVTNDGNVAPPPLTNKISRKELTKVRCNACFTLSYCLWNRSANPLDKYLFNTLFDSHLKILFSCFLILARMSELVKNDCMNVCPS